MKHNLFLILFMMICYFGVAQPHSLITMQLDSNDGKALALKKVYLTRCDTVIYYTYSSHQGIATFFIDDCNDYSNMCIVIRQDENLISRVPLDRLLLYDDKVSMPKMELRVLENRILTDEEKERIKNVHNTLETSNRIINGFFEHELIDYFGYVRWYFPSKLFLYPKESFYNYIKNEYKNGFELYGLGDSILDHYPNNYELDSIASLLAIKSSEYKNGLYSYYLMRLEEPVISNGFPCEVYRLSWINNYYLYVYEAYSIRVEVQDQNRAIMYVSYKYTSDCVDSSLYCDVIPLTGHEIEQFNELMQLVELGDWNTITEVDTIDGLEGTFIFEMYKNDLYKVLIRNTSQNSILNRINDVLWEYSALKRNHLYRSQRIE